MLSIATDAQTIHHQAISAQGKSARMANGVYISQTIGQQSVIGSINMKRYGIQQGFQQSLNYGLFNSSLVTSIDTKIYNSIETKFYPNPVTSSINFEFSSEVPGLINITIFDLTGKLVRRFEKKSDYNMLTIESLEVLPSGEYIIILSSGNYYYANQF